MPITVGVGVPWPASPPADTTVGSGDAWRRLVPLAGAAMAGLTQFRIMSSKTLTHVSAS